MIQILAWPGPLARMDPNQRNLTLAIGLSLLVHALLLSVHFTFPGALDRVTERALDVVLVNSKHARKPSQAQARAQANLDAGGNTEQARRATTPLPPSAQARIGDDLVQAQQRVNQLESQTRELVTRSRGERVFNVGRNSSEPMPAVAAPGMDLYTRSMAIARLEAQIDKQMDDYNKRPRKKFIGTRTEEYLPAQYLEDWRQKVERIGNLNYPEAARGKLYGSLVVYLEINSEGKLERAEIQRSSGHKLLDEAALRILRLASPFARFPDSLKSQFDILAFARTWSFTQADVLRTQ
ncbi:energy transducer TonB [Denitratisoma oestradiolicum]|uniref:Energy transducer TonB n=1 Tax=Denitratisoma oestradiolicum TaxID=311182 RepID=A0A6S6XNP3_9PROT|nr:TonB family protein [Denitratisoma oestradiolicum]CAB1367456.1 Energy transducer TonB [Denitratisoma oestradiolicum]